MKSNTWLPVMPWQMTLVYLLTQTLGVVEKTNLEMNRGSIVISEYQQ